MRNAFKILFIAVSCMLASTLSAQTTKTYTFDDVFRLWHMGKQYVYNIDFTMAGITFTPSVEEWIY